MVKHAKMEGIHVTAEVCPHHFTLTEDAVLKYGTLARMNPPVRTENDRLQIIEGGVSIVDLSIKVPNLAAAQSVCESWPYKYQNVYDKIMEELL